MRTIFTNEPFRGLAFSPAGRVRMGSLIDDVLNVIGVSEDELNELLDKLPSEYAGPYKQKLEECKAKGLTTPQGASCLYQLYQEVKGASDKAPVQTVAPTKKPAESTFPIVPVAIGGLVIAGLAVYFLVLKKK